MTTSRAYLEGMFLQGVIRAFCHRANNLVTQISGQVALMGLATEGDDVADRLAAIDRAGSGLAEAIRSLHAAARDPNVETTTSIECVRDLVIPAVQRTIVDPMRISAGGKSWSRTIAAPASAFSLVVYGVAIALANTAASVVVLPADEGEGGVLLRADGVEPPLDGADPAWRAACELASESGIEVRSDGHLDGTGVDVRVRPSGDA